VSPAAISGAHCRHIMPLLNTKLYKHGASAGQVITESEAAPISRISDVGRSSRQGRHLGADVENTPKDFEPCPLQPAPVTSTARL